MASRENRAARARKKSALARLKDWAEQHMRFGRNQQRRMARHHIADDAARTDHERRRSAINKLTNWQRNKLLRERGSFSMLSTEIIEKYAALPHYKKAGHANV